MEYIKRTDPYILRAGIFIVSALIALSIGIIVLGGGSNIFSSEKEFFTSFNNVSGLSVGAPVRLGGINVGRVTNIGYSSNPKSTRVQVTFA
ncbi:MAG: MCE family protein, partial [Candidatus Dadabacteria bacterium]